MLKNFLIISVITFMSIMNGTSQSLYEFKLPSIDGKSQIDFSQFKGKKILIVNTASKCGYTPQYEDLEKLYEQYKDKLVIIGIPANNSGGQEPGTNEEIVAFCKKNYGVTFPMTQKMSVKGDDMAPFIKWLLAQNKSEDDDSIRWNFEKFIFDASGNFVEHFRSGTNPLSDKVVDLIK
ncbi:MAG: glutathione peroxidase [Bacteroidetes bacterium]|nr:glutathione peroxidase [Bacteroidota bacterium]